MQTPANDNLFCELARLREELYEWKNKAWDNAVVAIDLQEELVELKSAYKKALEQLAVQEYLKRNDR